MALDKEDFLDIKNTLLSKGEVMATIMSGSMAPLIPVGAVIQIRPIEAVQMRRFDLIVFYVSGVLVCHFIWHVNAIPDASGDKIVITRNLLGGEDLPVRSSQILGQVVNFWIPFRTKLSMTFNAFLKRKFQRGFLSE